MRAAPETRVAGDRPRRVAIIAGGGKLPSLVARACASHGIDVFVVGLTGHADQGFVDRYPHVMSRPGAAGSIIATLRREGIADIVMIGAVRRPGLAELRPDLWTAKLFMRLGFRALGDNGLLRHIRFALEREGFRIHGAQEFLDDGLAAVGVLTRIGPDMAAQTGIRHAGRVATALGRLDIGQSVIVQDGVILGVEAAEGTDELIRRCAGYSRSATGPILVKRVKPQQDRDLDLPTIGPQTVRLCAENGMTGIAIEAGACFIVDPADVIAEADRARLFLIAMDFGDD